MQWLLDLEADTDPISTCRLMNVFRRKGVGVAGLSLERGPQGYRLVALVDSPESEIEHLYNYLRRTGGVREIGAYVPQASRQPSFLLVDVGEGASRLAAALESCPGARFVFAGQGKVLFELPGVTAARCVPQGFGTGFARFKSSAGALRPDQVEAVGNARR